MPNPRKLARSDYDVGSETVILTYESGHVVKVRGVSPARAVRLISRAAAEAKRSEDGGFYFHRSI